MIETVRQRFAVRDVRAAIARRTARPLPERLAERSLLVVLPSDEPGQRAAWAWVGSLDLHDRQVHPVIVGERVEYVPDRWAGAVRVIGAGERDWRRLPNAAARQSVWTLRPDVAVDLADPGDLGPALLVGASPAAVRIGRWAPGAEDAFDLMVQGEPDAASAAGALGRLLGQIQPPILPLR